MNQFTKQEPVMVDPGRPIKTSVDYTYDGLTRGEGDNERVETHHLVFQQGRNLYEAQVVLTDLGAGKPIDLVAVSKLLHELCYLINGVGQLRAYYNKECEEHDRLRKKVRALAGM